MVSLTERSEKTAFLAAHVFDDTMETFRIFDRNCQWGKPFLFRDPFAEITDEFVEFGMDGGLAADNADDGGCADQGINGFFESIEIHEIRFSMVAAEPRAVGTQMRTGIGDIDHNNTHVFGRTHGNHPFIKRKNIQQANSKIK